MTDIGATVARRQELVTSARERVAKILVPDTTHVGATILAQDALEALDEALADHAQDIEDARLLLEICGLLPYEAARPPRTGGGR